MSLLALFLSASLAAAPSPAPEPHGGDVIQGGEFQVEVLGFGHPVATARSVGFTVTPEAAPPELHTEGAGRLVPGTVPARLPGSAALLVADLAPRAAAPPITAARLLAGDLPGASAAGERETPWRPG